MCGEFPPTHRSSSGAQVNVSIFSSFRGTFEALCHFCVNEFEKFICEMKRANKKKQGEKKELGVGDKHP